MDEAQAGLYLLQGPGLEKMVGRAANPEARMTSQANPSPQRALQGLMEEAGDGGYGTSHSGYSIRNGDVPQSTTLQSLDCIRGKTQGRVVLWGTSPFG